MSVASGDLGEVTGGHVRIGAESHVGRNVGIVVGVLAVGALIIGFTTYSNKADAAKLTQLDSFRAAYADKCDAPAFRAPASALLKDTYLRSAALQSVVDKQAAALASGTPCEQIAHALKVADFPLPTPSPSE